MRRVLPSALLALALASCSPAPAPHVVLVTFDTTRYDRFGCTGDPEAHTPTVDALAARGLLFDRAFSSVGLTRPAHTTILTGLEPVAHGVHDNGRFQAAHSLDTLAEILARAGYDTGAFVSATVIAPRSQLDQGFDVYGAETHRVAEDLSSAVPQRPGSEVTDEALAWLAELREKGSDAPFFLWVHYYDPHQPRRIPEAFEHIPDGYRAEIAYADQQLGRLLDGVARAASDRATLVVFTADHGESLGEHGEATHGTVAYDSSLHVPLVLAGPGVPEGARSRVYARHVDIVPTVLTAARLPVPDGLSGRDLVGAAARGDDGAVGWFESEGPHWTLGWSKIAGVRTERWKYTSAPEPVELFDVLADPDETRNRADTEPEVVERMAALFEEVRSRAARPDLPPPPAALDVEEREQLAALGYVTAQGSFEPGLEPDPRRVVHVHSWVDHARGAAIAGRYARAIETLETIAESRAIQPLVLRTLAPVYAQAGRIDDAIRAYQRYIEVTGGADDGKVSLARTLVDAGRAGEALEIIEAIPERPPAIEMVRVAALAQLGRHADARRGVDAAFARQPRQRIRMRARLVLNSAPLPDGESELRALAAAAPDDVWVTSSLGYYLAVWGAPQQEDEAIGLLREAVARDPKHAELQANLGWGAYHREHDEEARKGLEAALAIDEFRQRDRVRLAKTLHRLGERDRALELVRTALRGHPAESWSDEARTLRSQLQSELRSGRGEGDAS